jgi:GntR family transcriptional regulator, transcriptional repressor for pyruvate dehydrogenase complex
MIAAHETVFNDPVGFRILDSRFHEKLSVIGGNAILQRIAYGLYNLGSIFDAALPRNPASLRRAPKTIRGLWRPSPLGTRLGLEKP